MVGLAIQILSFCVVLWAVCIGGALVFGGIAYVLTLPWRIREYRATKAADKLSNARRMQNCLAESDFDY